MLDFPKINLADFGVSVQNGFLPTEQPLRRLSDPYYRPWEDIMSDLPDLIATGEIRQKVLDLPILSTDRLHAETEWKRSYLVLALLTHAYIWGGKQPEDRLPPSISCPFLQVSSHLELPPCATYAALNLWNFAFISNQADDLTDPDNLTVSNSFTGTDDERWFFVLSVAIEACGAKVIPLVLNTIGAVHLADSARVTQLFLEMARCLDELGALLERMHERCRPAVFYHQIRPLLAGSKNMASAGLPNGVFYDRRDGQGEWHQHSGGSNAQSSLIQLFDIALGIEHLASGEPDAKGPGHRAFMREMRNYMPGPHRRFLERIGELTNIRDYATSLSASNDVRQAYSAVVMKLGAFRDKHIQIVSRYIITPATQHSQANLPDSGPRRMNLATATTILTSASSSSSSKSAEIHNRDRRRSEKELYGTGGTDLIPFLKTTRDETKAAALCVD